jgi:hypothetical protein
MSDGAFKYVVVHVHERDCVSELRPPMGPLLISQMIYGYVAMVEMMLTGEN